MRRTTTMAFTVTALAACVAAGAAVGQGVHTEALAQTPKVTVGHASDILPSQTAEDWVGYADHVVVARAIGEAELPMDEEDVASGEGYVPRTITLQVLQQLWRRPGWSQTLPATVRFGVAGWTLKEGERRPLAIAGTSRIERGRTYIIGMTRSADGSWGPLGSGAVLPFDGNVIGNGEYMGASVRAGDPLTGADDESASDVRNLMSTKSSQQLTALLNATEPDPLVAEHAQLDPVQRWQKVAEEKATQEGPVDESPVENTPAEENTESPATEEEPTEEGDELIG